MQNGDCPIHALVDANYIPKARTLSLLDFQEQLMRFTRDVGT